MINFDVKDKKILYQLIIDSRQSYRKIGKKVGLPKSVVDYRIKRMLEKGIIKNFYTLINLPRLGYIQLRFYIKLKHASPEKKKEIINYFIKSKEIGIVHSVEGDFELVVYLYIKKINDAYTYWEKTLKKYKKFFSKQILSYYVKEDLYNYSFLDMKKTIRKKITTLFEYKKELKVDKLDFKILKKLSINARTTTSEIAKETNTSAVTVSKRIKKMEKEGIIQGYRINIDFPKIGFRWHKIDIDLRTLDDIKKIISHLSKNPFFVAIDKTIGYKDLEIEFFLKDTKHLHNVIDELLTNFSESVENYSVTRVLKTHKYRYLPVKI